MKTRAIALLSLTVLLLSACTGKEEQKQVKEELPVVNFQ